MLELVFFAYWMMSAVGTKNTTPAPARRIGMGVELAQLKIAVSGFRGSSRRFAKLRGPAGNCTELAVVRTRVRDTAGAALLSRWSCLSHLSTKTFGKAPNWGMPMTIKENPELKTAGARSSGAPPDLFGRPGFAGTAIAEGLAWFILVSVLQAYFATRAFQIEERNMAALLPNVHRLTAYKIPRTTIIVRDLF